MIAEYEQQTDRKVRVFISSTFSDMQGERDVVVHSVFPRLREEFGRRLVDVTEVDLRWGIPEEQLDDCGILEICIDEVLHCAPFFVGIVGNRYGTIASNASVKSLPEKLRNALGDDIPDEISITELEMRAGVFVPGNSAFSCFFLKNDVSGVASAPPTVKKLVSTICEKYETRPYSNLADFEKSLYESLKGCIDKVFPARRDPPYGDSHYFEHLKILKTLATRYASDEAFISEVERRLEVQGGVCLVGEKGIGKSSCLGWIAKRAGIDRDENVFFHFTSAGNGNSRIEDVFHRLRLYLQSLCGFTSGAEDDHDAVVDIVSNALNGRRVTVFVDAVERLSDPMAIYKLFALRQMNRNIRVMCSVVTRPQRLRSEWIVRMGALSTDQIRRILSDTLAAYGKRLEGKRSKELQRKKECSNPLFLKAVLLLLVMYARYDSFDAFFKMLLASKNFGQLFSVAIDGIKAYFHNRGIDSCKVDRAIALMVHSSRGVTESELQSIAEMPPVARSVLLLSIDLFTIEDDGLIRFGHDLIVQAACEMLDRTGVNYREWASEAFLRHFATQPGGWRKFSELPFQLSRLGKTKALLDSICEPGCFEYLAEFESNALIGYLSALVDFQNELSQRLLPTLVGENRVRFVEMLSQSGCHRAAIPAVEKMIEDNTCPEGRIRLLGVLARSQYKMGANHFRSAIQTYRRLLTLFRKTRPHDDIGWASRAYLLGVTYKSAGKFNSAFALFKDCEGIFRQNRVCSSTSIWATDVYAAACYSVGKVREAEEAILRAVSECLCLFGSVSSELAWAYCYGWPILLAAGRINKATTIAQEAFKIYEQLFFGHGGMVAWAAMNAGTAAMIQAQYEVAEERLLLSIRENDAVLPPESRPHVYSLTAYANLACLYEKTGRHGLALETVRFALAQSRAKNGPVHAYTANILLLDGILRKSPRSISRAVSIFERQQVNTPDRFFALLCLARVLATRGDLAKAEKAACACADEYFSKPRETPLLTGLVNETCMALGIHHPSLGNSDIPLQLPTPGIYITHNNNSQAVVVPMA